MESAAKWGKFLGDVSKVARARDWEIHIPPDYSDPQVRREEF